MNIKLNKLNMKYIIFLKQHGILQRNQLITQHENTITKQNNVINEIKQKYNELTNKYKNKIQITINDFEKNKTNQNTIIVFIFYIFSLNKQIKYINKMI